MTTVSVVFSFVFCVLFASSSLFFFGNRRPGDLAQWLFAQQLWEQSTGASGFREPTLSRLYLDVDGG